MEPVAFLTLVPAGAAGTVNLKLVELPKETERDACARLVTFRALKLAEIASAIALEKILRHQKKAYRQLSQSASAFTDGQTDG